jgi:glycine/D-amino acid oxidase-like deaminating enzyme
MGAPISPASAQQAALFDSKMIEQVFACHEFAFDYRVLQRDMADRLDLLNVDVRLGAEVAALEETQQGAVAHLADGSAIHARYVFNVTYAQLNQLLATANLPLADLKHELAEIALIDVPPEIAPYGLTIMDGPFLSCMPFPATGNHSLTHVRYTPQANWTDGDAGRSAYEVFAGMRPTTRHRHMLLDAQRYVPAMAEARWQRSLHEVKTVLVKNERDDGRPILFQRNPERSHIISIMGGKIDNIYDLFDIIRQSDPEWAGADDRFVHGRGAAVPAS